MWLSSSLSRLLAGKQQQQEQEQRAAAQPCSGAPAVAAAGAMPHDGPVARLGNLNAKKALQSRDHQPGPAGAGTARQQQRRPPDALLTEQEQLELQLQASVAGIRVRKPSRSGAEHLSAAVQAALPGVHLDDRWRVYRVAAGTPGQVLPGTCICILPDLQPQGYFASVAAVVQFMQQLHEAGVPLPGVRSQPAQATPVAREPALLSLPRQTAAVAAALASLGPDYTPLQPPPHSDKGDASMSDSTGAAAAAAAAGSRRLSSSSGPGSAGQPARTRSPWAAFLPGGGQQQQPQRGVKRPPSELPLQIHDCGAAAVAAGEPEGADRPAAGKRVRATPTSDSLDMMSTDARGDGDAGLLLHAPGHSRPASAAGGGSSQAGGAAAPHPAAAGASEPVAQHGPPQQQEQEQPPCPDTAKLRQLVKLLRTAAARGGCTQRVTRQLVRHQDLLDEAEWQHQRVEARKILQEQAPSPRRACAADAAAPAALTAASLGIITTAPTGGGGIRAKKHGGKKAPSAAAAAAAAETTVLQLGRLRGLVVGQKRALAAALRQPLEAELRRARRARPPKLNKVDAKLQSLRRAAFALGLEPSVTAELVVAAPTLQRHRKPSSGNGCGSLYANGRGPRPRATLNSGASPNTAAAGRRAYQLQLQQQPPQPGSSSGGGAKPLRPGGASGPHGSGPSPKPAAVNARAKLESLVRAKDATTAYRVAQQAGLPYEGTHEQRRYMLAQQLAQQLPDGRVPCAEAMDNLQDQLSEQLPGARLDREWLIYPPTASGVLPRLDVIIQHPKLPVGHFRSFVGVVAFYTNLLELVRSHRQPGSTFYAIKGLVLPGLATLPEALPGRHRTGRSPSEMQRLIKKALECKSSSFTHRPGAKAAGFYSGGFAGPGGAAPARAPVARRGAWQPPQLVVNLPPPRKDSAVLVLGMVYASRKAVMTSHDGTAQYRDRVRLKTLHHRLGYVPHSFDRDHPVEDAEVCTEGDSKGMPLHMKGNFNSRRGAIGVAKRFPNTRFTAVLLDYFRMPSGYAGDVFKEQLFKDFIPELVRLGSLPAGVPVYIPNSRVLLDQLATNGAFTDYGNVVAVPARSNPLYEATRLAEAAGEMPDMFHNQGQARELVPGAEFVVVHYCGDAAPPAAAPAPTRAAAAPAAAAPAAAAPAAAAPAAEA